MLDIEKQNEVRTRHTERSGLRIKLIGVGGAGGNTINSIATQDLENVTCISTNTDVQALQSTHCSTRIQLGSKSTKGIGTGANPDLGKRAAEEDIAQIEEACQDADLVFLTGGLGGGTGSGALPVIARTLREQQILSVALVTKPFSFEGKRRLHIAEETLATLEQEVDTLITIPNQKLLEIAGQDVSLVNAFGMVNDIVSQFVSSISQIITKPGHINVDFADVKAIMSNMGVAVMGTGRSSGEHRAKEATQQAISSPLLGNMDIRGAENVLLNITGSSRLGLHEVSEAASLIYEEADTNASIVLGSVIDESMEDDVLVTLIATGFHHKHTPTTSHPWYYSQEQSLSNQAQGKESPHEDVNIPSILRQKPSDQLSQ